jgi:hypothetical protein
MITAMLVLILLGILFPEFLKGCLAIGLLLAMLFAFIVAMGGQTW